MECFNLYKCYVKSTKCTYRFVKRGGGGAFSSIMLILGENVQPFILRLRFSFLFFFEAEISSRTLIPLFFRLGSVHSG